MRQLWNHLWTRPAGVREVLTLALPLIVSTASWTLLQFTDRMFLMWYSPDAMAASLPAAMLAFWVVCFPLGLASYVNTFVAQYYGAGQHGRIGVAVWQGVWVAAITTPLAIAINPFVPEIVSWAKHKPHITELEIIYFAAMNYGAGAMVLCAALSSFFTGRGRARTVMIVDAVGALFNVVLDYLWIFGYAGFPEAGIAGAVWATVVSLWAKAAVYMILFLRPVYREKFQIIAGCRFDKRLMGRLLWFGSPSGMQFFVEVGGFTVFMLLVGRLGDVELAATTLAFNVNTLAFLPVWGIGIAATTLVGQRLGENRDDLAARSTWSAFWLAAAYMLVFSAVYVLLPDLLLMGHKAGMRTVEVDAAAAPTVGFAELRDVTVVLLRFVAFYCLFDAMNLVFASALKGAGDTRFVLIMSAVLSAVAVFFTWLGISQWGFGLIWSWYVVTAWIGLLGVAYWLRFLQGRWRSMRVIEPPMSTEEIEVPTEQALVASGDSRDQ